MHQRDFRPHFKPAYPPFPRPALLPLPPWAPPDQINLLLRVQQIEEDLLIKDRKLIKIESQLLVATCRISTLEEHISILKSEETKKKSECLECSDDLETNTEQQRLVSLHIKKEKVEDDLKVEIDEEYGEKIALYMKNEEGFISRQIKRENVEFEKDILKENSEIEKLSGHENKSKNVVENNTKTEFSDETKNTMGQFDKHQEGQAALSGLSILAGRVRKSGENERKEKYNEKILSLNENEAKQKSAQKDDKKSEKRKRKPKWNTEKRKENGRSIVKKKKVL